MLDKNDKLTKQIEKQMAEIEQMNEYIAQIEHDKSASLQASVSQDKAEVEKLSQKIEQLTKELSDRDQKYIQLMEKLKQTQDQFKAYEQNWADEMCNFISKDEHKQIMSKLQQENQALLKEVKKLLQTIENK